MRAALLIARKDLLLRLRDRSSITIGIVAPLLLAVILNSVTSGLDDDLEMKLGLVDQDGGEVGAQFAEGLRELGEGMEVRDDLTEDEARALVADEELGAAIVIPEGFSAGLDPTAATAPAPLVVLLDGDEELPGVVAESLAQGFLTSVDAVRLGVTVAVASDPDADLDELVAEAREVPPPVTVAQRPATDRELDATTYVSAGLAVFFAFFLVQMGVRGLLDEKRDGTMARLLVAPIPHWSILVAKALTSVVLGVVAIGVLAISTTVLMGADWGDPVPVALLVVTVVLAAVSIMGVVAAVATTSEQASSAQAVVAVVLGLLGGSFFQVTRGEGLLSKVALLTPHHWFIEGLGRARVGGLAEAWRPAVVLVLFALVVGAIGAVIPQRKGLT
jgi:ABC-2 type transport system permease protein